MGDTFLLKRCFSNALGIAALLTAKVPMVLLSTVCEIGSFRFYQA